MLTPKLWHSPHFPTLIMRIYRRYKTMTKKQFCQDLEIHDKYISFNNIMKKDLLNLRLLKKDITSLELDDENNTITIYTVCNDYIIKYYIDSERLNSDYKQLIEII